MNVAFRFPAAEHAGARLQTLTRNSTATRTGRSGRCRHAQDYLGRVAPAQKGEYTEERVVR